MQLCLYTTVINLEDREVPFTFLGKHGKRLAAGEQFSQPGDLSTQLAAFPRKFAALERALADGSLAIMSTPAVHLYDETTTETHVLTLANNSLVAGEPCWGDFASSDIGD